MSDSIDWELMDRYFAGELDEAHAAAVRRWLMAHPAQHDLLATFGRTLDGESAGHVLGPVTDTDAWHSWHRVTAAMHDAPSRPPARRVTAAMIRTPRTAARWRAWRVGTVAAITLAVVAAFTATVTRRHQATAPAAARLYTTARHERRSIVLPDGSTVLLGDASSLSVPSTFDEGTRTVAVQGEAFFTVTRHTGSPFIVTMGRAATRVLGTRFMTRRYDGDTVARVVVAEGRVAFGRADSTHGYPSAAQAVLPARTMGEYSDSGRIAVTPNVALDDALDWIAGRLIFRNTPLRDAVPRLERRYDVTIRIPEGVLETETFTSTFANEPLTQVLDVLALTFHATYTRSGPGNRVITFTPARMPVRRVAPARAPSSLAPEVSYGK